MQLDWATITAGHFGFVFEENSVREITTPSFSKSSVLKMFSVPTKRKAGVFRFLRFEERFRKAFLRDLLVWTEGLTVEDESCVFKILRRSVDGDQKHIPWRLQLCVLKINEINPSSPVKQKGKCIHCCLIGKACLTGGLSNYKRKERNVNKRMIQFTELFGKVSLDNFKTEDPDPKLKFYIVISYYVVIIVLIGN